jgi:mycothiol system anti-sigma-R factor
MNHDEVSRLMGAYLDGELDLTTCVKLEEHLAGCEACQREMEGEREMIEVVRSETPRFEAPAFLKTRILAAVREESAAAGVPFWKGISWWLASGIAVAALVVVLALGVFGPRRIPELVEEAVADHVRSLQVSHLMDVASTDQHTVKPWFAGKLDYSPPVIDLAQSGYPLIGGRLDVLDNRNVAAIIYQRRKHYINLFIWPSISQAVPGHFYSLNGYHVLGWTRAGMNYLAVSELGEKEFRDFVKMIQDQTVEPRVGE